MAKAAGKGKRTVQSSKAAGSPWRDRIVELRRLKPSEIDDHPHQWRMHPPAQVEAMRGMLKEVGIADVLLTWPSERTGRLTAFDGHLRKSLHPDVPWPTVVTNLTDAEADLMLASLDPLGAMATADAAKLDALLREVATGDAALQAMLSSLAASAGMLLTDVLDPGTDQVSGTSGEPDGVERQTLAERFLVPPFSVLDARQGYWQERKRAWLALGIQSELGRGGAPGLNPRTPVALVTDKSSIRGGGKPRQEPAPGDEAC